MCERQLGWVELADVNQALAGGADRLHQLPALPQVLRHVISDTRLCGRHLLPLFWWLHNFGASFGSSGSTKCRITIPQLCYKCEHEHDIIIDFLVETLYYKKGEYIPTIKEAIVPEWVKKTLLAFFIVFVVFYLFTRPEAAAEAVRTFLGAFDAIGVFFTELVP